MSLTFPKEGDFASTIGISKGEDLTSTLGILPRGEAY